MTLLSAVAPVDAVLRRPHGLLEGPRLAADGEMVYSDVIAGGVFACTPAGEVRELLAKRRGIGGILAHERGGWVVSGRTLLHVAPDGSQRELLAGGEDVTGYNDIGSTPDGELLAGVLRYRPLAGETPREGRLLLLARDGSTRVLCEEVLWPNGIGVAPDGRTVYLSDYARRCVLVTDLAGAPAQAFATMPEGCSADGLALDAEGGVWVALGEGGGVARFRPDGSLDERIDLPASFVSSLSFGGEDGRDVLVTTADNVVEPELGGTLLRARSEVAGLPVYAAGV
jgi:sugar lactone lactonase YvrE